MKRLCLCFVPIIVAPILASCSLDDFHMLDFECSNCYLEQDGEKLESPILGNAKVIELKLVADKGYKLPDEVTFTAKTDESYAGGTYDSATGDIRVQMTDDITITAAADPVSIAFIL